MFDHVVLCATRVDATALLEEEGLVRPMRDAEYFCFIYMFQLFRYVRTPELSKFD